MGRKAIYRNITPLAQYITKRLDDLGLKQVDFCRQTGFDQGLLSKLQTSVITTINLESALRLADGLQVSPGDILMLLGKTDLHALLIRLYGQETFTRIEPKEEVASAITPQPQEDAPEPVRWIAEAANRAHEMGRDISPAIILLRHLSAERRRPIEPKAVQGGHS
jgi:transcriptional regulator with XRE-family HTH domain